MIRGMLAGALTLIALQVFGADNSRTGGINGPARGGAFLSWLGGGVAQLISPDKAAIPNVAAGKKPPPTANPQPQPQSSSGDSGGVPESYTLPSNPTYIST